MKVNFNRAAFAEALNLLASVVPSRTPKPILRCVRVDARGHGVRLYATDLDVGIEYSVAEVQVGKEGEVVVPADRLLAIVRESTDDVLALQATEGSCEIMGADSHFRIYSHESKDYPTVPSFEGKADVKVALRNLQAGVEQCLFATAKESSRYAINGVLWEMTGKKLTLVATDGRRLARCKVTLVSAPEEHIAAQQIIVPAKAMSLLDKLASHDKDKVEVKLVDNQILLSCANAVISSSLVEGSFPKYDDIIPTDYTKKLRLSTEAVLSAVRRAALLTSEESRGIKLLIAEGSLVFSGKAPETGDAEVNMAIDYKGETMQVGFNPQFLVDALRVIRTPEFEMELGDPDRPGLIRSGSDFLYVLMPINLG
jgi:DNA polymerase-3 subunit beta